MIKKQTALTLALGTAFAASFAVAPVAKAADNPFAMDSLKSDYQVVDEAGKKADGKCGATKGMSKADREANAKMMGEGKCGEGKCGVKNVKEGKCGEGKCGAGMK